MGFRLDGKAESIKIRARLAARVSRIPQGVKPELSVVLVGGNLASETFVKIKKRFGEDVGMNVNIYRIVSRGSRIEKTPHNPPLRRGGQRGGELQKLILRLNRSKRVHGILLQLPLPKGLQVQEYIDLIDRAKDVDGLRRDSLVRSPVAEAVRHLLEIAWKEGKKERRNKKLGVLLVKSDEFANSLLKSLSMFPVEWKVERVASRDMRSHVSTMRRCDIAISALGFPHAITSNMIKRDAVIIDVGFTKVNGEIMGDFHPDCYKKTSFYSPVPGGVGPLTVAYVFKNLMKLFRNLS